MEHDPSALEHSILRVRRLVTEASSLLIDRPAHQEIATLGHLRMELIDTLADYQRCIHKRLDDALDTGDAEEIARATALKIGAITLANAYRAYTERWLHRDALVHWPEYRLSAQRMINAIVAATQFADVPKQPDQLPIMA